MLFLVFENDENIVKKKKKNQVLKHFSNHWNEQMTK